MLTESVVQRVTAEPILALPGWCIQERIGRREVFVFNPKSPRKFFVRNRNVLSPELIQLIAYQLEQKCRTVKRFYTQKK